MQKWIREQDGLEDLPKGEDHHSTEILEEEENYDDFKSLSARREKEGASVKDKSLLKIDKKNETQSLELDNGAEKRGQ